MPSDDKSTDQVQAARASLTLAFSVLGQVGLLTLGVVVGVLVLGLWLDRTLGTKPLFTLLLFLASFPASMFIIYRVSLNAVGKIQPAARPPAEASPPSGVKEDVTSDDNSSA